MLGDEETREPLDVLGRGSGGGGGDRLENVGDVMCPGARLFGN